MNYRQHAQPKYIYNTVYFKILYWLVENSLKENLPYALKCVITSSVNSD